MFAFALQGQNIKLEFKPVKGVEYPVNLEVNQTTTLRVPMMGDMVTESEQILGAVVTLAEETEQGYVVEACLTRVTLRTSAQGQTKVYDSEGEDIMSQAIRSLMGKPFKMLVSPLGQVLEQFPVRRICLPRQTVRLPHNTHAAPCNVYGGNKSHFQGSDHKKRSGVGAY